MNIMDVKEVLSKFEYHQSNPVTQERINEFEVKTGIKFGNEYNDFLQAFGCLAVESVEVYGICGNNDSIPSAIHATLRRRLLDASFPKDLLVIGAGADGALYCVDQNDEVYYFNQQKLINLKTTFLEYMIKTIGALKANE